MKVQIIEDIILILALAEGITQTESATMDIITIKKVTKKVVLVAFSVVNHDPPTSS